MFTRRNGKSFRSDENGNISIIFGLMVTPFVAFAGISIDFSNGVREKSSIQTTLDAAALAAGRAYQVSGDVTAATIAASTYVESRRSSHPRFVLTTNDVDTQTGTINLAGRSELPTAFMGILGSKYDTLSVRAAASSSLEVGNRGSNEEVEVVMSLDVTGSMRGAKLTAMQDAAKDLVEILLPDNGAALNRTRIGLVPFADAVRPPSYLLTEIREDAANGNANGNSSNGGNGASKGKSNNSKGTADLPTEYTFTDRWGWSRTWHLSECVGERHGSHAFSDKAPNGQHYYAPVYTSNGSCRTTSEMMPLTNDKRALKNHIDDFVASGYTAGHLGTAFAFNLLSPKWKVFLPQESHPSPYNNSDLKKVAILMTDGAFNTQYTEEGIDDYDVSDNSSNGLSTHQSRELCDSMKAKGITIYTVSFEVRNQDALDMMEYCASTAANNFVADHGNALRNAFRTIAFSIAELRLTD